MGGLTPLVNSGGLGVRHIGTLQLVKRCLDEVYARLCW